MLSNDIITPYITPCTVLSVNVVRFVIRASPARGLSSFDMIKMPQTSFMIGKWANNYLNATEPGIT